MPGLGTVVNLLAVLVGGGIGATFRGKLKLQYQQLLLRLVGLCLIVVGMYEFIQGFFVLDNQQIEVTGTMLILFALLTGTVFGVALNVEKMMTSLGTAFKRMTAKSEEREELRREQLMKTVQRAVAKGVTPPKIPLLDRIPTYDMPSQRSGDLFTDGYVIATLLLCANSMLLNGVMADVWSGETQMLFIKSAIDGVLCLLLGLIFGNGVLFATLSLLVCEGGMTLVIYLAGEEIIPVVSELILELLTPTLTGQLSVIGAVILIGLGISIALEKKLKVANMIPAFLIPVVYYLVLTVVEHFVEK